MGIGVNSSFYNPRNRMVVCDYFKRADNASTLGKSDNNLTWTPVNGTWGIQGGKAMSLTKVHNDICTINSTNSPFVLTYTAKGTLTSSVTFSIPSSILKYIDPSNFIQLTFTSTSIVLNKKDTDTFYSLATYTLTTQDNFDYNFRIEYTNDKITIYNNGLLIINYSLTTAEQTKYSSATKAGIRLQHANTPALEASFSKFIIEKL